MLLCSAILHAGVGILPHHVIDRVHYICHLLDKKKKKEKSRAVNITQNSATVGVSGSHTSLVMQPSLLRSYILKAQLSLSVMEPLKMIDRLVTKSCSRKKKKEACDLHTES